MSVSRRGYLTLLGVGAAILTGCASAPPPSVAVPPIAKPFFQARRTRNVALTVDDGYDAETLAAYVKFCEDTGIHLTFSAIGSMKRNWEPLAGRIAPLVERGQVQIVNHTFSHRDLTKLSEPQMREDISRNSDWIAATFKTDARPYFRPPGGYYNARVQAVAADLGYPRTLLWGGTFGDSAVLTPAALLAAAQGALHPGTVVLAHANHPAVTKLYSQITALIKERNLTPVTIDELFA